MATFISYSAKSWCESFVARWFKPDDICAYLQILYQPSCSTEMLVLNGINFAIEYEIMISLIPCNTCNCIDVALKTLAGRRTSAPPSPFPGETKFISLLLLLPTYLLAWRISWFKVNLLKFLKRIGIKKLALQPMPDSNHIMTIQIFNPNEKLLSSLHTGLHLWVTAWSTKLFRTDICTLIIS